MKLVISVFRYALPALAVVFAVIAGLLIAVVSGLIEYHVVQQWLLVDGERVLYLPLIIVIALETTKLFTHFSGAAFTQNHLEDEDRRRLEEFQKIRKVIQWALVLFSFVCSLIFTANTFYYKIPGEESDAVAAAKEAINEEYEKQLEDKKDLAEIIYNNTLEAARIPVDNAKEYFESIEIVYTPRYEYERTKEMKEAAKKALEEAERVYKQDEAAASKEREEAIQAAKKELDEWREKRFNELETSELMAVSGDNPYLSSFLLFFSKTFFGDTYSRESYYIWVILISLALSALMEGIISMSQYVISFPVSVLKAISGDFSNDQEVQEELNNVVRTMVSAAVAFFVFLIYGAFQEISYNKLEVGAAIACSILTVLVPSAITAIQWKKQDTGIKKAAKDLISEVRASAIKGMLSFAGFVLIGLLFGEAYESLSMSAIGISIGNSVGHMLHLLPDNSTNPEAV